MPIASPRYAGQVLVFQPRPGMGDLIWHLPLIRAIAAAADGGQVILMTKRSTQADILLRHDLAIRSIVWFDRNPRGSRQPGAHDGLLGFPRLVATLRRCRADTGILLHHAAPLAAAMQLAGIGRRHAYGFSAAQRLWLNAPPALPRPPPFTEAFDQAEAFASASFLGALEEPCLTVEDAAGARVEALLRNAARPWLVLGIGAQDTHRQWPATNFARLARALLAQGPGTAVLLGSAQDQAMAQKVAAGIGHAVPVTHAIGWKLEDAAALLSMAETFVGNDSGPMNLRAALGRPAYALFGASGPLRHSRFIRPIMPPGGPRAGMEHISVDAAARQIIADNT